MNRSKHGLALRANLPALVRENVMSAKGVWIAALVQRQALAEQQP
jgi:hypothetical protein